MTTPTPTPAQNIRDLCDALSPANAPAVRAALTTAIVAILVPPVSDTNGNHPDDVQKALFTEEQAARIPNGIDPTR